MPWVPGGHFRRRGSRRHSCCVLRTATRRSSPGPRRVPSGSVSMSAETQRRSATGCSRSAYEAASRSTCGSFISPIRRSHASAISPARWSRPSGARVVAIEPLGRDLPLYDITTGTGDFIADGVVSHNCFARPTHTYLDFDAGRDFEREIVVKVNAPERLRMELARPAWKREHIALGTNTDPYQWAEGRYRLTRGIWEAMIEARNPGSVLTKSPLLLRDLELMSELNRVAGFSAALSVPTVDERAWRATEPHTPIPGRGSRRLPSSTAPGSDRRAGGAADARDQRLSPSRCGDPRAGEAAGATYVRGIALASAGRGPPGVHAVVAGESSRSRARYRDLYRRGAYAPPQERRRLARLLKGPARLCRERAMDVREPTRGP